jgi:hypothetical protein
MAPIPRFWTIAKKFHGNSPHRRNNAKLSTPLGSPASAVDPRTLPKTNA